MIYSNIIQSENTLLVMKENDLIEVVKGAVEQIKKELEKTTQKSETYLSRQKVAEMLDVDLSTLWRWNKINYLVPIAIGSKKRYRLSDINRILNKN